MRETTYTTVLGLYILVLVMIMVHILLFFIGWQNYKYDKFECAYTSYSKTFEHNSIGPLREVGTVTYHYKDEEICKEKPNIGEYLKEVFKFRFSYSELFLNERATKFIE